MASMWDSEELAGCQTSLLFQCWPFILPILLRLFNTLYFLRKTRRLKVNMGAFFYYYLFNRKEKLTTIQKRKLKWPNKFSVLYFGFLVCATTSSSWSPPGSQEHFKLLSANNWKQRKKSLYVVGATTLPPLNHMTCVFMAPLTLDMQTSIPWPVSISYYSWGWAAHHTTKPGGTVNTLEIFHTLPGKLSFLLLFSPYWIHEPICSKQMSIGHIGQ